MNNVICLGMVCWWNKPRNSPLVIFCSVLVPFNLMWNVVVPLLHTCLNLLCLCYIWCIQVCSRAVTFVLLCIFIIQISTALWVTDVSPMAHVRYWLFILCLCFWALRDPVNLRCTEVLSDEKPNSFHQAHFSK